MWRINRQKRYSLTDSGWPYQLQAWWELSTCCILSNKQIVAVARYSSGGIAIRQVLTVLWVTRCFRVMTNSHKNPLPSAVYAVVMCVWLVYVSVHLSVCLSQAGAVSKRLNGSSRFWHGSFLPLYCKDIPVATKIRYFPLQLCPKFYTLAWKN